VTLISSQLRRCLITFDIFLEVSDIIIRDGAFVEPEASVEAPFGNLGQKTDPGHPGPVTLSAQPDGGSCTDLISFE